MSAEILGIEPIMDHLRDLLEAEMPSRIVALNAQSGDFVLPPVSAVYIGGTTPRMDWPCGILKELDPRTLVGFSAGAIRNYPVAVGWFDADDGQGPEMLNRRLWRYRRLAEEIVMDHRSETGFWMTVSDPEPLAEGPYPIEEEPDRYALVKGSRFWFQAFELF
jgi:hypothetical protein